VNCGSRAGVEAALAEQRRRGAVGQSRIRATRAAVGERRAQKATVATVQGQLDALDLALRGVLRSKLDAAKVAQAVAALVRTAREVLVEGELAGENAELRALIAERLPELRKQLRSVP
jgi:hypothetical protein